jgi:hypothetical protein
VTVTIPTDKWTATIRSLGLQIKAFRSGWEETSNPVYIWETIAICAKHKKPLPDWVMDYLVAVAERMTSVDARAAKDLRKVLPSIMGFPAAEKHGPRRPLDPVGGEHEDVPSLVFLFATGLEKGLKPSAALRYATAKLLPDVADHDERTLIHWIMQNVGLERRPRTSAEWKAVLRSHIIAFIDLIEQESRETQV